MFRFFLILFPLFLSATTLKDFLTKAQIGDYIVYEDSHNCLSLKITQLGEESISLEEWTLATHRRPKDWPKWMEKKGPRHTSHLLYTVDLKKGSITSCYNYDKEIFIAADTSFLATLFTLDLIEAQERKKVGLAPKFGEEDKRKSWNPPLIQKGKKIKNYPMSAYTAHWPEDPSPLSKAHLTLYFTEDFPFPHWIETEHEGKQLKFRAIDSGHL